jgi:hypothetical protein
MQQLSNVSLFQKVLVTNLHCRIFDELDYIYLTITEHVRRFNERGKNRTLVEFHGAGSMSGWDMCPTRRRWMSISSQRGRRLTINDLITGCIFKRLLLVSELQDSCQQFFFTWLDISGLKSVSGISAFDIGKLTPALGVLLRPPPWYLRCLCDWEHFPIKM